MVESARRTAAGFTLAEMLAALRETALQYDKDDPRYGLIAGLDEGDTFTHVYSHQGETPTGEPNRRGSNPWDRVEL